MVDSERDFFTEAVTFPLQLPCFDLAILSKQNSFHVELLQAEPALPSGNVARMRQEPLSQAVILT